MSENQFYVYEHFRPDKGVCFYVGKGKYPKRAWDMRTRSRWHSVSNKGKKRTDEQNAARRKPRLDLSKEAREKMGDAARGNKYRLGIIHTEETREKLRAHGIARIDTFRKYAALGPAAMSRRVVCLDDGATFESASAAARHYDVDKSALIELCLGRRGRKTAGGRKFKYIEAA